MHKYGVFLLVGESARSLVGVNYTIMVPKMKSFVTKCVSEPGLKNSRASVGANRNESSHPFRPLLSVYVCVCVSERERRRRR